MEKLKCNVVMLSTEKASVLKKGQTNKLGFSLAMMFIKERNWENQHLYFTSKREIKEGDWYFDQFNNVIIKANENSDHKRYSDCYKIEATTDPSLGLPLIPQSFVEKYVEVQGNIKEVMIEIADRNLYDSPHASGLKVRKDNTVICSPVKDTFTRDEVTKLINDAYNRGIDDGGDYADSWHTGTIDDWIKDTL